MTITYTKLLYPDPPKKNLRQISKYLLPKGSGNLELEQTKFLVFSLCFGKISKFPVFSLTGIFFCHFPCFPCGVGTLNGLCSQRKHISSSKLDALGNREKKSRRPVCQPGGTIKDQPGGREIKKKFEIFCLV